jgi:hypothetical protein
MSIFLSAIDVINSGFQLFKNLKSLPFNKGKDVSSNTLNTIPERFIYLFECHGVHRNQIPAFFGHGITLHAMTDLAELNKQLTPEILQQASSLFGVRQDWLECVSDKIYNVPDFYKHPEEFELYIAKLKQTTNELWCYVLRTRQSAQRGDDSDGAFLFVETIGVVNNREVVRYYPVGHLRIGYWKSRADFAANCGLLIKSGIHQVGKYTDKDWLKKLNCGTVMPKYDYQDGSLAVALSGAWHIDEFFERPEHFLKGVDAEANNFGLRSAINRWLRWSAKGYFDAFDDGSHPRCRKLFERKLEELQR